MGVDRLRALLRATLLLRPIVMVNVKVGIEGISLFVLRPN